MHGFLPYFITNSLYKNSDRDIQTKDFYYAA